MPELHDNTDPAQDEMAITKADGKPSNRTDYLVESEAGLFKNGEHYPKGTKVPLDPVTAQRFIDAGDVSKLPESEAASE